jgi:hypothetical protein
MVVRDPSYGLQPPFPKAGGLSKAAFYLAAFPDKSQSFGLNLLIFNHN